MACLIPANPPNTAPYPDPPPPGSHAYAQELLDRATAPGSTIQLGYYELGELAGIPTVAQFTHHTKTQGKTGCFPAVTLFRFTGTLPTPLPSPPPSGIVTTMTEVGIDWPLVGVTASLAVGVVYLFHLALKHAGRRR